MKKLIFGIGFVVAGLTASVVTAQDYCCPVQCDPCCGPNFEGFYVGGNLGVYTNTAYREDLFNFSSSSGLVISDTDFTAGLQVGYDWLCDNKLLGLVVDWNWVNVDHKLRLGSSTADEFFKKDLDWFTTIRARLGLTFCDSLLYLTIGAVVSDFDHRWNNSGDRVHYGDTRWGWTGGVGIESIVWCNWSVGFELLFMHFDTKARTRTSSQGTVAAFAGSDSAWVGRFIVNYRFGDLLSCWCR